MGVTDGLLLLSYNVVSIPICEPFSFSHSVICSSWTNLRWPLFFVLFFFFCKHSQKSILTLTYYGSHTLGYWYGRVSGWVLWWVCFSFLVISRYLSYLISANGWTGVLVGLAHYFLPFYHYFFSPFVYSIVYIYIVICLLDNNHEMIAMVSEV